MPPITHPLRTVFRTQDARLIRNKDGPCSNCDKKPPPDVHFRKCTACQLALYCGEACQKEDWGRHKGQCTFARESADRIRALKEGASEAELADLRQKLALRSLLRDFTEAHSLSFRFIAGAQLFLARMASAPLDEDPKVLVIPVRPREPEGTAPVDPARAFVAGKGMFLPLARILDDSEKSGTRLKDAWAAAEGIRARLVAQEANNPWFTGLLPVLYRAAPDVATVEFFPQCRPDAPFRGTVTAASERGQVATYGRFVELGVMLRPDPGVKGEERYVPGYLRRAGVKWRWTPLFKRFPEDPEWQRTRPGDRDRLLERKLEEARRA